MATWNPVLDRRQFLGKAALCGTAMAGLGRVPRVLADEKPVKPEFALTSISGKPRERGQQYGARYQADIRAMIDREIFNSVTNIGKRPTFGDDLFAIETHLLNFHPIDVTAQTEVEISFLQWRRPEIKFPSVEALKEQIGKDVRRAQRYFRLAAKTLQV